MAVVMDDVRVAASRALMARLRGVKSRGPRPGQSPILTSNRPVVLAIADELFVDVVQRMHAYSSPVLLAVYYPAGDRLELAEAGAAEPHGAIPVGAGTTIGMVLDAGDALALPGTWETIRVSQLQVS